LVRVKKKKHIKIMDQKSNTRPKQREAKMPITEETNSFIL